MSPGGLNLQILGFFAGTIDSSHLPVRDPTESFKIGESLKARVLYAVHGATPPQFSLSLLDHVLKLDQKLATRASRTSPIQEFFPVGVVFEHARVVKVEAERGLIVDLGDGIKGFVHVHLFLSAQKVSDPFFCRSRMFLMTISHLLLPILVHGR